MIIRKAEKKDLRAIWNLVEELAIYEKAPDELITTVEEYEQEFEAGLFDAIVAEEENEIIGMCLFYYSFSTWKGKMLYLEDFVVKDSHRGKGVGRELFDFLVHFAKKQGCELMKWQVLDWNKPALNFYQKYHAIIEKEWWNGKLYL